jgi:hypothetical protein
MNCWGIAFTPAITNTGRANPLLPVEIGGGKGNAVPIQLRPRLMAASNSKGWVLLDALAAPSFAKVTKHGAFQVSWHDNQDRHENQDWHENQVRAARLAHASRKLL